MKNKTKWIVNTIALTVVIIIIVVFIKFLRLGLFASQDALKDYVMSYGALAPLVFVFIQALQVIIAPIPGNITGLAGGAMFGVAKGFLLNSVGLMIGSVAAYYLARIYGRKLVYRIVEQKNVEKYENKISGEKGTLVIFGLFLLPFFPDDALCFLAGLAGINIYKFTLMVLFGRIPGMYIASVIGDAALSGIDIKVVIVSVIYFAIIIIAYRYRKQIISRLHNIGKKNKI